MKQKFGWSCLVGLCAFAPSLGYGQVNIGMQQVVRMQANAVGGVVADADELQAAMRLEVDTIRRLVGLSDGAAKKLDLAASAAVKNVVKNTQPSKGTQASGINPTAPNGANTLSDEDAELRANSDVKQPKDQPFPPVNQVATIEQVKDEEIWKKSIASVLSPEQAKAYESFLKQRAAQRRQSVVSAKADDLDECLQFTLEQRPAILELIDKKLGDELVKQPRRVGFGGGQVVLMMAGQASLELKEEDLKPILSPVQLAEYQRLQNTAAQGPFGALKRALPPGLQGQLGLNESTKSGYGFGYRENDNGVEVESVEPNSAAESLGLHVGDVIEEIDGAPIDTAVQLRRALNRRVSSAVRIKVKRNGKSVDLNGELK
jgi:hypothetical protein